MKVGTIIRSYVMTDFLEPVLKSCEDLDKIVVLNYRLDTVEPRYDNTEEIVKRFGWSKIIFEKGTGLKQHEMLNRGIELLPDCDYIFITDADELVRKEDKKKIIEEMEDFEIGVCPTIDYFGDFHHKYHRIGKVVTVIKNNVGINFPKHLRNPSRLTKVKEFDYNIYHFSLIFPDDVLKWKIKWEAIEENVPESNWDTLPKIPCDIPDDILAMVKRS